MRSILLFSRVPWREVRTLAADAHSRTSVQLARIILRDRFGVEPQITALSPDLESMLRHADSALIIGDPALRIQPEQTPLSLARSRRRMAQPHPTAHGVRCLGRQTAFAYR